MSQVIVLLGCSEADWLNAACELQRCHSSLLGISRRSASSVESVVLQSALSLDNHPLMIIIHEAINDHD